MALKSHKDQGRIRFFENSETRSRTSFLTISEVSRALGLSYDLVYREMRSGSLEAYVFGSGKRKTWRTTVKNVEDWLRRHQKVG